MSSLTANFVTMFIASLVSACVGWFARPTRGQLQLVECSVILAGIALGCVLGRDLASALGLASLCPGVYYAFNGWQSEAELPEVACAAASYGASFFLLITTHRWDYLFIAAALGIGGSRCIVWVTRRTNRVVGLTFVLAAVVFQLTRIPLLLAN